jgi:hypothetical protein
VMLNVLTINIIFTNLSFMRENYKKGLKMLIIKFYREKLTHGLNALFSIQIYPLCVDQNFIIYKKKGLKMLTIKFYREKLTHSLNALFSIL